MNKQNFTPLQICLSNICLSENSSGRCLLIKNFLGENLKLQVFRFTQHQALSFSKRIKASNSNTIEISASFTYRFRLAELLIIQTSWKLSEVIETV